MATNEESASVPEEPVARSWRRLLFPATLLVALAAIGIMYQFNGGIVSGLGYFYQPFAYVLVSIGVLLVFRFVLDRITPYDDTKAVVDRKIGPIGLQRGGLYAGLFIGMSGSLMVPAHNFVSNVGSFAIDAGIMAAALIASTWITDKFLLVRTNNAAEMERGNWAVAIVELGNYLALGFILNGAFAGVGGGWLSGLEFWLIGQATLAAVYGLYEWRTQCNVDEEIGQGNVALAIEVGGFMLAIGIVLRFAIVGPFEGYLRDVFSYLEALVPGLIAIALVMVLIDVIVLPKLTLRGKTHHGNISASLEVAAVAIGAAVVVGAALAGA